MDTKAKHDELRKLAKKSRSNLFEMLRLASEIVADPEYCDEFGGPTALTDHLEATDFAHFGGKPSLANMLRAYAKNPERATWDQYQHNIWAMIELAKPAAETAPKDRIDWKARAKALEVKVEMLEASLADLRNRYEKAIKKLGRERVR